VKHLLVLAALCAGAAHADPGAYRGLAADATTTAIGLSLPGIADANPIGLAGVPIRLAVLHHAGTLPEEQAQPVYDAVEASGWGAAVNNVLVIAGAGPVAPVLGLVVGFAIWKAGEPKRHFLQACAVHKADNPELRCVFAPLKTHAQGERP
jgi:hypothetical protein